MSISSPYAHADMLRSDYLSKRSNTSNSASNNRMRYNMTDYTRELTLMYANLKHKLVALHRYIISYEMYITKSGKPHNLSEHFYDLTVEVKKIIRHLDQLYGAEFTEYIDEV